eukprot:TRINITY_DN1282_c0_g1_i8.p2 TRINITY_DN1282_c0_g1~~TRINITY_DN1282_c0_g1_i8.p2  ORF type:complete len:220 (-),score=-31.75 TRINITY_DN1282_c0_g1_i8:291-950(-)
MQMQSFLIIVHFQRSRYFDTSTYQSILPTSFMSLQVHFVGYQELHYFTVLINFTCIQYIIVQPLKGTFCTLNFLYYYQQVDILWFTCLRMSRLYHTHTYEQNIIQQYRLPIYILHMIKLNIKQYILISNLNVSNSVRLYYSFGSDQGEYHCFLQKNGDYNIHTYLREQCDLEGMWFFGRRYCSMCEKILVVAVVACIFFYCLKILEQCVCLKKCFNVCV